MSPQELSAYITNLLRSSPEVIASFFMGVLLTGMLTYAFRRWIIPGRDTDPELVRKDAEIARKEAEITRRDAHIFKTELRVTSLEEKVREKDALIESLRNHNTTLAASSTSSLPPLADHVGTQARCARLEAENRELGQSKQSLEQTLENLRTELGQVSAERDHLAKWIKFFDEENARLSERGSLTEG